MKELRMPIKAAGLKGPRDEIIGGFGRHWCGEINDGVSLLLPNARGPFVVDFESLRAFVAAAEKYRAQEKK
jgi:hypothetical protein